MTVRSVGARLCAAGVLVAVSALLAGCEKSVAGMAVRDPNVPPGKILKKSDIDELLLSPDELDGIMGASGLGVTLDEDTLNDNSDAVSDPDCAGAAYGAQEVAYGDSGYTAVRDQIVREPGDNNAHWLEQVVALYPSAAEAKKFLQESKEKWQDCAGSLVTYDSSDQPLTWEVSDVTAEDTSITQMSTPEVASSGGCHHSMAVAANVIAEAWACGDDVVDQATSITSAIGDKVDNA